LLVVFIVLFPGPNYCESVHIFRGIWVFKWLWM